MYPENISNNFSSAVNDTGQTDYPTDAQLHVIKVFAISNSILGTAGNALTIAAIIHGRLYQQNGYMKIINLLVCNLIHSSIFLPLITIQAFTDFWTDSPAICNAVSFGIFCNLGTELIGYCCISLNRYFSIVNRKWYDWFYRSPKKLAVEFAISWMIYPVILALPLFGVGSKYEYVPKKLVCHPFPGQDCEGYCLFVFLFAILTSAPVIGFCYIEILFIYYKSKKKLFRASARSNAASINSNSSTNHENYLRRHELKMALTILLVILCFGFFRLPFILLYMYDPSMNKVDPLIHTVLIYAGSILCWVNPIIYAMTNKRIRLAMKNIIRKIQNLQAWSKLCKKQPIET